MSKTPAKRSRGNRDTPTDRGREKVATSEKDDDGATKHADERCDSFAEKSVGRTESPPSLTRTTSEGESGSSTQEGSNSSTHGERRPDAEVCVIEQMEMMENPNFLKVMEMGMEKRKKEDLGIISTYVKKLIRENIFPKQKFVDLNVWKKNAKSIITWAYDKNVLKNVVALEKEEFISKSATTLVAKMNERRNQAQGKMREQYLGKGGRASIVLGLPVDITRGIEKNTTTC